MLGILSSQLSSIVLAAIVFGFLMVTICTVMLKVMHFVGVITWVLGRVTMRSPSLERVRGALINHSLIIVLLHIVVLLVSRTVLYPSQHAPSSRSSLFRLPQRHCLLPFVHILLICAG